MSHSKIGECELDVTAIAIPEKTKPTQPIVSSGPLQSRIEVPQSFGFVMSQTRNQPKWVPTA